MPDDMNTPTREEHLSREVDLVELLHLIWSGKWHIIISSVVFTFAGLAYALYLPNVYKSTVLVAPATDEPNLGNISGQLGGLASLAGINIGESGSKKATIAKKVLISQVFLANFIKSNNLEAAIYASERWDNKSEEWVYDRKIYNPENNKWQMDKTGESSKPTDYELVKKFKDENLLLTEDKENGFLTLSVKSRSPIASLKWAKLLISDVNEHMRKEDIKTANARISYLKQQLENTNLAGMRQIFYQLIERETQTVMLANADLAYVFKVVNPPVLAQEKAEPNRALITIIGTIMGIVIGCMIFLLSKFFKRVKS